MTYLTYKIYTLGCKVNQYDSNNLEALLAVSGLELVEANAQVAIINTCAVTESAIRKTGRTINLAKKENPDAKIVLTGCVGELRKKNNIDFPLEVGQSWADNIDLIWGTKDYEELVEKIKELLYMPLNPSPGSRLINMRPGTPLKKGRFSELVNKNKRSRYTIKIQDGCEQFCTYCVIPHTRGPIKSRGEADILEEIKEAIKQGYQEIVLSGIHLGLYGKDIKSTDLVELIKKIIKLSGLGRIRLSSIELNEVTDELIELIKIKKVCSHLHIPLQSGCDKILKHMNRPYSLDEFKDRIKTIRRQITDIAITTDVIVGFPGETEEDFEETYNSVKELKFSRLHVFPFSPHKLTPASKFKNQIDEKTKKERAKKLRALGYRLAQEYRDKFKINELEIVLERVEDGKCLGKTEYYFDVWFTKEKILNKKNPRIKQLIKIKKNAD